LRRTCAEENYLHADRLLLRVRLSSECSYVPATRMTSQPRDGMLQNNSIAQTLRF
jgi:hypothetical protein